MDKSGMANEKAIILALCGMWCVARQEARCRQLCAWSAGRRHAAEAARAWVQYYTRLIRASKLDYALDRAIDDARRVYAG